MKKMKKCHRTQKIKNKRGYSAGIFFTSSAGAVTSLISCSGTIPAILLPTIIFLTFMPIVLSESTYATSSILTISVMDSVSLNITPTNTSGTFAHSDTSTNNISITTNNGTGYTLGIKASTNGNNALTKITDNTKTISSHTVSAGVSETNYSNASYASTNNLNNTWGYRPSKYYNTASNITVDNTTTNLYFPGPTSSSTITTLDKTTAANPTTANEYNLAIGARINNTTVPGNYTNTFILTVVANPALYSITYNKNTTDTVTSMPANVSNQQTSSETVTISNTVPERDSYLFKGWCTVQTVDGDDSTACTTAGGTTYNPNGGGTAFAWTIDQTLASNSLTLYAMWVSAGSIVTNTTCSTPIPGITYMQELSDSTKKASALTNMTQGTQYVLIDNRDNQGYCVSKEADGNIWMTQNLDLCIGCTGVQPLTSENSDINISGSGIYRYGYTTSDEVITWSPSPTAKTSVRTISGTTVYDWENKDDEPFSAEGGDKYYYTTGTTSAEIAQTLAQCTEADHIEAECAHYHVGNYYNWTAAVASNDSSIISTQYDNANNSICPKGWKLPSGRASDNTNVTRQFGYLFQISGITNSLIASNYATNGFNNIRISPLFFVRGGYISSSSLENGGSVGNYWSSTVWGGTSAYSAYFYSSNINSANGPNRRFGYSVRCMVR